jgi:hypothetical protein
MASGMRLWAATMLSLPPSARASDATGAAYSAGYRA